MQLHNLLSVLLLSLALGHAVTAAIPAAAPPRGEDAHKFVKRGHHVHYHTHNAPAPPSSGGMFGNSGSSMAKTIVGGTALAGGAAFAATAGSIGAHRLFDKDHEDDDGEKQEKGSGGGRGADQVQGSGEKAQPMSMQPQGQQMIGTTYPVYHQHPIASEKDAVPVAILMSDGSYRSVPEGASLSIDDRRQQQQQPTDSIQAGPGQTQPNFATGRGGFVFPSSNEN
ncbi:uncharacterized protein UMAG_06315 [Mycosarcoma maydis]|uniref:Uncharacterized protein n=1 Tax=Mycosarcoma maydis TaxID=5270 RepID=A0A0D1CUW4_MYCMD|nr:uncharacterized protein UMAG_06315 [Ustilago maydis 521]KIS70228.1 hypothetical protein UMAG_06315 [Ustilago maydis 521]|eukprot:XP_011388310.1 hypothetical protein UMAG_06315 [Ustilago maydis 521]